MNSLIANSSNLPLPSEYHVAVAVIATTVAVVTLTIKLKQLFDDSNKHAKSLNLGATINNLTSPNDAPDPALEWKIKLKKEAALLSVLYDAPISRKVFDKLQPLEKAGHITAVNIRHALSHLPIKEKSISFYRKPFGPIWYYYYTIAVWGMLALSSICLFFALSLYFTASKEALYSFGLFAFTLAALIAHVYVVGSIRHARIVQRALDDHPDISSN